MIDREKVIKGFECCKYENKLHCNQCPYDYNGRGNERYECTAELSADAIALLKEQEEKIRQLESMNVSASGNGTAIGVVKGGLVIQKGQNNKHIVNNGTITMTFGK